MIRAVINGQDFIEMVQRVEQPFWTAEGHPGHVSAYEGIPAEVALLPSRHLLGRPNRAYAIRERPMVLQHTCREPGCWPLTAEITVADEAVGWKDFRQPHRTRENIEWAEKRLGRLTSMAVFHYEGLGPFEFDRKEYEAELTRRPK